MSQNAKDRPLGPMLFDVEEDAGRDREAPAAGPAEAPPVPDLEGAAPQTDAAAMQRLAEMAAKPPNRLARWFWGLLAAIVGLVVSVTVWSTVATLLAANPVLGAISAVVLGAFGLVCLLIALREIRAFARLGRLDTLQHEAARVVADQDLDGARRLARTLTRFYGGRPELRWGRDRIETRLGDMFDADAALGLVEQELLAPLDQQAQAEVAAAARRVATVTAIVPLALVDVITAFASNLGMVRAIAEIYGGRSGTLETWRLIRAVLTHLVATGAVAVGDDLIGSVAGGSVVSRVSRRFGEGIVNGALTARVGVAAMEVCRPLPFARVRRPSVSKLVQQALTGLFNRRS